MASFNDYWNNRSRGEYIESSSAEVPAAPPNDIGHRIGRYLGSVQTPWDTRAQERFEGMQDENGNVTPDSIIDSSNAYGNTNYEAPDNSYSTAYQNPAYDYKPNSVMRDLGDWTQIALKDTQDMVSAIVDNYTETNPDYYDSQNQRMKDSAWKAYEDVVARPAGAIAVTPGVPIQARAIAGLMYLPKMGADIYDSYNRNVDAGGGTVGSAGSTAKEMLIDPVTGLASEIYNNPGKLVSDVKEHPINFWDRVLAPASMVEIPVRTGMAAKNRYGEAMQALDDMNSHSYEAPDNVATDMYPPESNAGSVYTGAADIDAMVNEAAARNNIDPALLAKVIEQESSYGRNSNAAGNHAQISDELAERYGLDKTDPAQSIEGGARYLREQLEANGGDVREALAAYNAGPNNKAAGYGYADEVLSREIGGEPAKPHMSSMDAGEQNWLGAQMPNGENGCVEAVVRVGSYHDSWLAEEARKGETNVDNLVADAGDRVIPFDESKLEKGDVIVYGDNEHVVLYDGKGGYVGNSTGQKKVVHGSDYRAMDDMVPTKIIKTAERPDRNNVPTRYEAMDMDEIARRDAEIAQENDANLDVLGNKVGGDDLSIFDRPVVADEAGKAVVKDSPSRLYDDKPIPDDLSIFDRPVVADEAPRPVSKGTVVDSPPLANESLAKISKQTLDAVKQVDDGGSVPAAVFSKNERTLMRDAGITFTDPKSGIEMVKSAPLYDEVSRRSQEISSADTKDVRMAADVNKIVNDELSIFDTPVIGSEPEAVVPVNTTKAPSDLSIFDAPVVESSAPINRTMKAEPVEIRDTVPLEQQMQSEINSKVDNGLGIFDAPVLNKEQLKQNVLKDEMSIFDEPDISYSRTGPAPSDSHVYSHGKIDLPVYSSKKHDGMVSKADIMDRAQELFVPLYTGRTGKDVLGYMKRKAGSMRTAVWGDINTMAHEIGHVVDTNLNLWREKKAYHTELESVVHDRYGEGTYERQHVDGEGMAEFMKDYLQDESAARVNFPNFYKAFKEKLAQDADMSHRVDDLQNLMHRWHQQDPEARVHSGVRNAKDNQLPIRERMKNWWDKIVERAFDDKDPLKAIDSLREELLGRKLNTEESVYKNARVAQGAASSRANMLISGEHPEMVKDAINKIYGADTIQHAVTLNQILTDLKKKMKGKDTAFLKAGHFRNWGEALDSVLAARRFQELQKLDIEAIDAEIRDIEAELAKDPVLRKYYEHKAYTKTMIQFLKGRDFNIESIIAEMQKKHKGRYEIIGSIAEKYQRLYSLDKLKEEATEMRENYKAPFDMRDAADVVDRAPRELHEAAEQIYQHTDNVARILQATGMISEKAYWGMQKYKNYFPLATEYQTDAGLASRFGIQGGFTNVGDAVKSIDGKTDLEKSMPIKSPLECVMRNTYILLDKAERNKVSQIFVKGLEDIKGAGKLAEEVYGAPDPHDSSFAVWIDGDRHVYQTQPEFYRALESIGTPEAANFAIKILRWPTQQLRMLATLMPDFIVRNGVRDAASASIFSSPKVIAGYGKAIYHILNQKLNGDQVYHDYVASGALSATLMEMGRDNLQANITKMIGSEGLGSKIWNNSGGKAFDLLHDFSSAIETIPRIAEYERTMDAGKGVTDAALNARDVTLDFSKAGSASRQWNMIDAFFNASIQESVRICQAFKENPKATAAKVGAVLVLPSAMLWFQNHDQEWYQDRPNWEKNTFWMAKVGDEIIKVPKPFGLGVLFASSTERILDMMKDNKQFSDAGIGWLSSAKDAVLPNVLPSAFQPALDVMSNHSIWMDQNIISDKLLKQPSGKQVDKNTSSFAKSVNSITQSMAEDINNLIGTHLEGVSPKNVDYLGKGYGAGAYTWATGAYDAATGQREFNPFGKAFTANKNSSKSVEDFYNEKDRLDKLYNAVGGKENLNKMSPEDKYNYNLLKAANGQLQQIGKDAKAHKWDEDVVREKKNRVIQKAMDKYMK